MSKPLLFWVLSWHPNPYPHSSKAAVQLRKMFKAGKQQMQTSWGRNKTESYLRASGLCRVKNLTQRSLRSDSRNAVQRYRE